MEISIVVPVYNVETFIIPCLQSLVMQGFGENEYEILCIDDGSTDLSVNKIKEFQINYPEVRIISQKNEGVSSARNKGIYESKGKFLYFCDSDDFLEFNQLKPIVNIMKKNHAISASFKFDTVAENTSMTVLSENIDTTTQKFAYTKGKKRPFYSGNIFRFIFDRKLIIDNNIIFKHGMTYAEDELFLYHICRYLNFEEHLYFDNVAYHYRIRNSSLTHRNKYDRLNDHWKCMYTLAQEYKEFLQERKVPKVLLKTTKTRYKVAIATILWDKAMLHEEKAEKILIDLGNEGLYPFGFCIDLLRNKNIKTFFVNFNKFMFNIPLYFIFFYNILEKVDNKCNKKV